MTSRAERIMRLASLRRVVSVQSLLNTIAAVSGIAGSMLLSPMHSAFAQTPWVAHAFPVGEQLLFQGKMGFFTLGSASMTVLTNDTVRAANARHLQLTISANLLGVYRLDDSFDSWVDCTTGFSRRFMQSYDETNQQGTNTYDIHADSSFYRQSGVDSLIPTVAEPLDETAFLYWVRTLDLDVGDTLRVNRYFRPDRNPITIAVLARDTIDVPAGRFTTLVLQPTIPDGGLLFSEEAESRVWISDDDRRLVVQIKVKLAFAPLALVLREFVIPDEEAYCNGPSSDQAEQP